jgi:formate dehydrogenase gamma subunit
MKRYVSFVIILLFLIIVTASQMPGGNKPEAQAGQEVVPTPIEIKETETADVSLDCAGCHGAGKTLPYLGGAKFHTEAHEAYSHGYHAKAVSNGSLAASCLDCHTTGGDQTTILPKTNPRSTINRANIAKTCGSCHSNAAVMEGTGISTRPFLSYQESAHARALSRGNINAAVCTDCHNSHDILPASDARSPIFKANIPGMCATCHGSITAEFTASVHGEAAARGVSQSPVCTDCHGIHSIKAVDGSKSALGTASCAQCHAGVRLTQEFGLAGERVQSYEDSYHGLARKLGSNVAADCASCHGVHNILPSSNPKSMIHPDNLVQTCGQCHPGAGANFALGKVHLVSTGAEDIGTVATNWVRWIYLGLIFGTVGAMAFHNLLVWRKKVLEKKRREHRTVLRMTSQQRLQHWLLLTSFTVLVVTGFALAYPEYLSFGMSETMRRLIHRAAGVVMMLVGIYHLYYLAFTAEGRRSFKEMLPKAKDGRDLIQNIGFLIGTRKSKPKFDKFGYGEKAEYWAVVWGTFVMGLTGVMIWYKVEIFSFLPRWIIDVAITIHFYEAVLATLAIIVWHFYNVIFDPDVYPVNLALVDGRVSEEYYKEEHELDYERMKKDAEGGEPDDEPAVEHEGAGVRRPGPASAGDD